jgi:hypothetical protein
MEDEPRIAAWDAKVDWPLTGLAVAFLGLYTWQVLDTGLDAGTHEAIDLVLTSIWVLFGLDYAVRIALARNRRRFVGAHLLDLAILLLPMIRPLRALRVITVIGVLNRSSATTPADASRSTSVPPSPWSPSSRRSPCWRPSATLPTPRSRRSARRCGGRSRRCPRSATATATRSPWRVAWSRRR